MRIIFNKKNMSKGFTIIEVLIACVIISTTTLALASVASTGIQLSNRSLRQVQANLLMEEGAEAVKSIRDNNWTTISDLDLDTDYYLSFDINTNSWTLGQTPTATIDGVFTRVIVFSLVYRDDNDDIASSGEPDLGTKSVNVSVSWPTPSGTNSKNINFYLANIFN